MKNYAKNNLKKIRNKKGLLQIKVAIDLNVTQETISSYETGRVLPSSDMLINLANYYNTSIDYLLCRTEYDLSINSIKPNNVTDKDFNILNKLSETDKQKIEAYIDGLNDR